MRQKTIYIINAAPAVESLIALAKSFIRKDLIKKVSNRNIYSLINVRNYARIVKVKLKRKWHFFSCPLRRLHFENEIFQTGNDAASFARNKILFRNYLKLQIFGITVRELI